MSSPVREITVGGRRSMMAGLRIEILWMRCNTGD
jgi:hypothetical protein